MPKQMTKDDKTAGRISTDCVTLARVMPCLFNDMDNLLKKIGFNETKTQKTATENFAKKFPTK